jgi:metal-responsive CopG/Arc/MetJ family transcriptional regulator
MNTDEIKILKSQLINPFKHSRSEIWVRAFREYNEDHPTERPLHSSCRVCYYKVFKYHETKENSDNMLSEHQHNTTLTK